MSTKYLCDGCEREILFLHEAIEVELGGRRLHVCARQGELCAGLLDDGHLADAVRAELKLRLLAWRRDQSRGGRR